MFSQSTTCISVVLPYLFPTHTILTYTQYFSNTPWPAPHTIASECNGDPLFLAIYRELTHRHWHAVSRPSVQDRIEGWDVYRELFDEILMDAEDGGASLQNPKFFLTAEWVFDILNEFVYQFQGFCQFRTALHNSATKHGILGPLDGNGMPTIVTGTKKAPHHVVENTQTMQASGDAPWAVETVLHYLHRLVAIGTDPKCTAPAYQYLGIFASVSLSRLECLLSDFNASLAAMAPLFSGVSIQKADMEQPQSAMQAVHSVLPAHVSLTYHAAISFVLLRRYKDAVVILNDLCATLQRGFKTGELKRRADSDQLFKNYDRLIALLALCTALCPAAVVDEALLRTLRDKHGAQISRHDYADLYAACAPKYVSPNLPSFVQDAAPMANAYQHQVAVTLKEWNPQASFHQLRSYLKLYTSIPVSKVEAFGNDPTTLVALKLKLRQLEQGDDTTTTTPELKSCLDLYYYIEDEVVHIVQAESSRPRFETYFVHQISNQLELQEQVKQISTKI